MLINNNLKIPTEIELFKSADKFTRERFWKLWLSSQILVSKDIRNYLNLCHRYLRWADDVVDSHEIGLKKKKDFIRTQQQLVKAIINNNDFTINHLEEFDLYYTIKFSIETQRQVIINEIIRTLSGLQNDVDRIESKVLCSEEELKVTIALASETICNFLNYFLLPDYNRETGTIFDGAFLWFILSLKDFNEDVNIGLINISREDVEKFKLDIKNLIADEKRFIWMEYKYPYILKLLERDKTVLKTYPLKIKLFWVPGYFLTIYRLIRIKEYGFQFGIKVNNEGFKKIIVFAKTIILYVNFNIGVFIK